MVKPGLKVLIAAGGTGGHINPGVAIANKIMEKRPDAEITFVGTTKGMETKLVPAAGYKLRFIRVRGFRRRLSADTLIALKEAVTSVFEARRIIRQVRPDMVIGTGGYVTGPVILAATMLRVPAYIHEANAMPGITTKLLARRVKKVLLSFEGAKARLNKKAVTVVTGNPLRADLLKIDREAARAKLGIPAGAMFVVCVAGSRGALHMNTAIAGMIRQYGSKLGFRMAFATGDVHYDKMIEIAGGADKVPEGVEITRYIYDAATYYNAADLVVSRAGSTTCELLAVGAPALLIPSPYVTENHQEVNARSIEKDGAAEVMLEKDLDPERLYKALKRLTGDPAGLAAMSRNARKSAITDAADRIYEAIFGA